MMRSKAGKMTAKTTIITTVNTRTIAREICWRVSDLLLDGACPAPIPQRTSNVATRGRALFLLAAPGAEEGVNSLQWHFRERNDGDEYYDTNRYRLWVVGDRENVCGDLVADNITEHQPTDDCHRAVQSKLHKVRIVFSS
jgi:hypothetical protein